MVEEGGWGRDGDVEWGRVDAKEMCEKRVGEMVSGACGKDGEGVRRRGQREGGKRRRGMKSRWGKEESRGSEELKAGSVAEGE